jgi:hypothetical protein
MTLGHRIAAVGSPAGYLKARPTCGSPHAGELYVGRVSKYPATQSRGCIRKSFSLPQGPPTLFGHGGPLADFTSDHVPKVHFLSHFLDIRVSLGDLNDHAE